MIINDTVTFDDFLHTFDVRAACATICAPMTPCIEYINAHLDDADKACLDKIHALAHTWAKESGHSVDRFGITMFPIL